MTNTIQKKKVVYLFGAGASHGSVKAVGSAYGILMRDLGPLLNESVHELIKLRYPGDTTIVDLVNTVIDEDTDFEHVITFLDESPSAIHRRFAEDLRGIFVQVLRQRLELIERELGDSRTGLYSALLDMHQVPGCQEELAGILTLNYDDYIERAVAESLGGPVDFGINIPNEAGAAPKLRLLKLHGSFGWHNAWPVILGDGSTPLWIPPGIQKAKDRYPFNILWGLARELLDCDVLRIVGCRLGPNDWDLISLLFTTCHASSTHRPYTIEVIDAPAHALELQGKFPYLNVQSILEVEPVGRQFVSELIGGAPRPYTGLAPEEQKKVGEAAGTDKNWFRLWLKQMAEAMHSELGSVKTELGKFEGLLESYS